MMNMSSLSSEVANSVLGPAFSSSRRNDTAFAGGAQIELIIVESEDMRANGGWILFGTALQVVGSTILTGLRGLG